MKKPEKDEYLSPVPNNPRDNERYVDKKARSQEDKFNRDNMLFGSTDEKFLNLFRTTKTEDRYGFRTAAGHWKDRDEPDAVQQERQADAIKKILQQNKVVVGRDRLKAQNKVPIRAATGKKLFEQFCREAYKDDKMVINHADIENIYNAARHLSYEKWLWFMWDAYGNGKK
jgi:hypothetical protein